MNQWVRVPVGDSDLLAQLVDPDIYYLLWSGQRGQWWAPDAMGYTAERDRAGRYPFADAMAYVARSASSGDPERVTRLVLDV